jgi:type IV pilus assembly protein PilF
MRRLVPMFFMVIGLIHGSCSGKQLEDNAKRSMAQYELAVGLNQERNSAGAFQAAERAIELDPSNARAHLFLGLLYLFQRSDNQTQYDPKAEYHFKEVLRIQTGENAFKENLGAEAHNNLGVLYIHQKRYTEAVKELKIAVADLYNRRPYLPWGNLGLAYYEMAEYEKAIQALLRALELQPLFCVGYYRLGQVYMATRSFEKADKAFTRAVEADKRCDAFQDAWRLRGEVRAYIGERDQAIADLEKCVELDASSLTGQACLRLLETTH